MTQYKTKDGQEIKVGGVYLDDEGDEFHCLAFKPDGQNYPIMGFFVSSRDGEVYSHELSAHNLTSLPESQPEYDPEQMWVVWYKPDAFLRMSNIYYQSLEEAKAEIRYYGDAFAIAPVGKKFKRGTGL